MTTLTTTLNSNCNNETFTIGSYNGFSILIRDKDGYVNATKLVNDINDRDSITKELKNIIRSPEFQALEKEIMNERRSAQFEPTPPHYILPAVFSNELRGTYVYRELLTIICVKASVKYLRIVSKIMDQINIQAHLLEVDGNDHLQDTIARIKQENEDLKSNVNNLNKVIINNEKRMVPKEDKQHYNLMLYYDTPYILKLVRRSVDSWTRKFDRIKNSPDCVFYRKDLPISMTFGKQLKSELAKCNILMINNIIEINNKDQEDIIINQIEYILEYLNNSIDDIDNSDTIEKELEEKHKDGIEYLKENHDFNLLNKTFTTMKLKMEK
jgi:hypothetical protein